MTKTTKTNPEIDRIETTGAEWLARHNEIKPANMMTSSVAILITITIKGNDHELPLLRDDKGEITFRGRGVKPSDVGVFDDYNVESYRQQIIDYVNTEYTFKSLRVSGSYWRDEAELYQSTADIMKLQRAKDPVAFDKVWAK